VSLTVDAAPTQRIAGTPLVPRTTRKAHGKATFWLHKVLSRTVALNAAGRGSVTFTSPHQPGFYLGRITFGGTALILPGRDADMDLGVFSPANFRAKPSMQFVDPTSWSPCP